MKFWQRFNKNTFRGIAAALVVAAAVMGAKKLHLKSIIHELLWFLQGDTNVKYLDRKSVV